MSDEQRLERKMRLMLYVIGLLHLVYLGLAARPHKVESTQALTHYAWSATHGAPRPACG